MVLNGGTLTTILPLGDLYTVYRDHKRLTVFAQKGRKCVRCGREGVLLLITKGRGGTHVDLYTDDFILMTVDHIVPKKVARQIGWTRKQIEDILNKQPMCSPCNGKKGHSLDCGETIDTPPRHKRQEVISQLVFNESIFSRSLEGVT
jgi:5-methylcytosine-specific restriction endonuclease McrA